MRHIFFTAVALLLTSSCNLVTTPSKESKSKLTDNILHANMKEEPPSLDPRQMRDRNGRTLLKMFFEGLTRVHPDGKARLAAAENVTISENGLTYTFTLRNSRWSNGDKVTAHDFEYSWKTALSPDFKCTRADIFYIIKNARQVKSGELSIDELGVKAIDEKTLVVQLSHPAPYFFDLMAYPLFYPVNHKIDPQNPNWHDQEGAAFVCNGPFHLKTLAHNRLIQAERNEYYWDRPAVQLEGIDISIVKDPYTAVLMFENGELDWVGDTFSELPIDTIPSCKASGRYHSQGIAGTYWFNFNTQAYPLNSTKLRQALALALERSSLVSLLGQAQNTVARQLFAGGMWPFSDKAPLIEENTAKAKRLLSEALVEMGITKEELPVIRLAYSDVPGQKTFIQAVQQRWETILGLNIVLEGADWNTFLSNLIHHQFHICGSVMDPAYNDPTYYLDFFRSKNSHYNAVQWENAAYQHALKLAELTIDPTTRQHHLYHAAQIIADEVPILPINYEEYKWMQSSALQGVFISELGQIDFKWASLQR